MIQRLFDPLLFNSVAHANVVCVCVLVLNHKCDKDRCSKYCMKCECDFSGSNGLSPIKICVYYGKMCMGSNGLTSACFSMCFARSVYAVVNGKIIIPV